MPWLWHLVVVGLLGRYDGDHMQYCNAMQMFFFKSFLTHTLKFYAVRHLVVAHCSLN